MADHRERQDAALALERGEWARTVALERTFRAGFLALQGQPAAAREAWEKGTEAARKVAKGEDITPDEPDADDPRGFLVGDPWFHVVPHVPPPDILAQMQRDAPAMTGGAR